MSEDGNSNDSRSYFYQDLFEKFARIQPENALLLSYLYSQEDIVRNNFKSDEYIHLNGNFEIFKIIKLSNFGSNIHSFAEDFYSSSETYKKINQNINSIPIIEKDEKQNLFIDMGFKL